ncbi:hypothetical protein B4135_0036 [Caldibacillus debilis]|jgi:hypothetical protein|uniref:Uncharacterized protein n=1 Tax=Caldibacillus debilis TaxID=301148 RepID=A0A150M3V9_9BACI|nr:hypothetical protein B4135_0036 [Caldibacillus debilis]
MFLSQAITLKISLAAFFLPPERASQPEAQKEKRKVQDSVPPRPSSQTYKLMSKK